MFFLRAALLWHFDRLLDILNPSGGFRKPSPEAAEDIQDVGTQASPGTGRARFHQSGVADSPERCPREVWALKWEERKREILATRKMHFDAL